MKIKKITAKEAAKLIPKKSKLKNKNDFGHALIIGGSKKYLGAGILASLAATRAGAGYVHLMSDLTNFNYREFPDFILSNFSQKNLKDKINFSIGFGPGVGLDTKKISILKYLINKKFSKVVLDADGLTILSRMKNPKLPDSWILTPHEGELSRLISKNVEWIKANRIDAIKLAHKKYQCHILLKGADTLIIDKEGNIFQSSIGRPSLAKAGSGDVLTGIIVALKAIGLSSIDAIKLGVTLHSLCSVEFEKKNDELSLRPIDIINLLPKVIKQLRKTI